MKSRQLFLIIIFIFSGFNVLAQKKTTVQIENADNSQFYVNTGASHFVGNCKFRHGNAELFCDSADYFEQQNLLNAYGNVRIIQADTITVTSKRLKYDGNSRKAELFENVTLTDGKAVLTTEYLNYDMNTRVGTYPNGGKITNKENILTSTTGYYYVGSKDAFFRYNVKVITPQAEITSDTLKYNTNTRFAYFFGPTRIKGKDDFLYTENGWYNTSTDQAQFSKKSYYESGTKMLKGDSLYYDRKIGYGKAVKNVLFIDTAEKIILTGDYGQHNKPTETTFVTGRALLTVVQEKDSLYLTADTLKTIMPQPLNKRMAATPLKKDSGKVNVGTGDTVRLKTVKSNLPPTGPGITEPMRAVKSVQDTVQKRLAAKPVDSIINIKPDSLKIVKVDSLPRRILYAYRNVRIFKSDLQAVADSLVYTYADSTMRCYKSPAVWTQGSQMTANQIDLELKNKKIDKMKLNTSAFIASTEGDSTLFNQISGRNMVGLFKDNKLSRLTVLGNGESIYYPKEDSVKYTGMNRALCSNMLLTFKDNKIGTVRMDKDVEGALHPLDAIPAGEDKLKGFNWRAEERPVSKEDIYRKVAVKIIPKENESKGGRKIQKATDNPPATKPPAGAKKQPALKKNL